MSAIESQEILSETEERTGVGDESKLVAVAESIRYRRRAQGAEKQLETLTQELADAKSQAAALSGELADIRREQELTRKLAASGVGVVCDVGDTVRVPECHDEPARLRPSMVGRRGLGIHRGPPSFSRARCARRQRPARHRPWRGVGVTSALERVSDVRCANGGPDARTRRLEDLHAGHRLPPLPVPPADRSPRLAGTRTGRPPRPPTSQPVARQAEGRARDRRR